MTNHHSPLRQEQQAAVDGALFEALAGGHWEAFKKALTAGADPDAKHPETGACAVIFAIQNIPDDKKSAHFISRLLKRGADPDARNEEGLTGLMLCVLHEKPQSVFALVLNESNCADISIRHPKMGTAMDMAKEKLALQQGRVLRSPVSRVLKTLKYVEKLQADLLKLAQAFTELAVGFNDLSRRVEGLIETLQKGPASPVQLNVWWAPPPYAKPN
jgi:hypothetical protein